jgi:hypothetical protein
MRNPTVVENHRARYLFSFEPAATSESMRKAIGGKEKVKQRS